MKDIIAKTFVGENWLLKQSFGSEGHTSNSKMSHISDQNFSTFLIRYKKIQRKLYSLNIGKTILWEKNPNIEQETRSKEHNLINYSKLEIIEEGLIAFCIIPFILSFKPSNQSWDSLAIHCLFIFNPNVFWGQEKWSKVHKKRPKNENKSVSFFIQIFVGRKELKQNKTKK